MSKYKNDHENLSENDLSQHLADKSEQTIRKNLIIFNKQIQSSQTSYSDSNKGHPTNEDISQYSKPFRSILPLILTLCLSSFYFGYGVVYFGSLHISVILDYYNITMDKSLAEGMLNGMTSLGGGIGCLIAPKLMNKFSRRQSIIITSLIAFVAGSLIYIPNQSILFIMRIVQGICIGLYSSIVPMYIKELSPINFAGTFGAFVPVFMSIGTFFGFFFTYLMILILNDPLQQKVWYFTFGFTQITVLIQLLILFFVYQIETPKYLILKDKQKQTKLLLKYLYKQEFINVVYDRLKQDFIQKSKNKQSQSQFNQIDYLVNQQCKEQSKQSKYFERKTPLMAIFAAFFMSFSQQMTGMGAVVIYGGKIAGQVLPQLKDQVGFIINSPNILSAIILSYLMSQYSRKLILQCGMLGLSCINLMIGVAFLVHSDNNNDSESKPTASSYIILIGEFLYNIVFGVSAGSILWVIMPAIVQPSMVPYSTLMNWVSSAMVLIVFPLIRQQLPNKSPAYLFIFFAGYTFVCFIIYFKLIIQIQGKTQKQIHQEYSKMKINCNIFRKKDKQIF